MKSSVASPGKEVARNDAMYCIYHLLLAILTASGRDGCFARFRQGAYLAYACLTYTMVKKLHKALKVDCFRRSAATRFCVRSLRGVADC